MLYHLLDYLASLYEFPGDSLFRFISFRAAMAALLSLVISMITGRKIVRYLRKKQVGESIRDLGLEGQTSKAGTPTMGGLIILAAILVPTLLFGQLDNIYVILMLGVTVFMGLIGFLDDYIKVFRKNKKGLAGKFKIAGQVIIGLAVGITIVMHDDIRTRDLSSIYFYEIENGEPTERPIGKQPANESVMLGDGVVSVVDGDTILFTHDVKTLETTLPFIKDNEFDYARILAFLGEDAYKWIWILFIPIVIFIITAVSNGANLTDGLDGLATGVSAIIVLTLLVFAYISGNFILADYFNIMFIPDSGELVVFSAAFVGACIGFLWYNSYPASVFMGDTGSLAIGGIIACLAILIRKELMLPLLCGIFLIETLSVMLQVVYFKITKRMYGEGRRIFRMSPLHHHYQKVGMPEPKIVTRFWIMGIFLAILTVVTLKIR